jgi:formylglycine-generating enzyme required for sulfatase activity
MILGIGPGMGVTPLPNLLGQPADPIRGWVDGGNCWIAFSTQPAWSYRLECSTNLTVWETLVANIPGTGGELQILDPEAVSSQTMRFYRVAQFSGPGPGEPSGNPDPSQWTWIAPGTFTMGSAADASVRESDESPQTATVLTKGFWMCRFEVTQQEYLVVMGNNPSWFDSDPNRPVENVSWVDATNYCARLTAQEQAAGRLPAGYFYRLPSEAEWEYSCRAGSDTTYSYAEDPAGAELGFYAWYWDNSGSTNSPPGYAYVIGDLYYTTQPVGTRQVNPWGLYDMHGSIWEWCLDWYGAYQGGNVVDPAGPPTGDARIIRGGSWDSGSASCRSANRSAGYPQVRSSGLGFRAVLAQNP